MPDISSARYNTRRSMQFFEYISWMPMRCNGKKIRATLNLSEMIRNNQFIATENIILA
jgi:hypothetical protein